MTDLTFGDETQYPIQPPVEGFGDLPSPLIDLDSDKAKVRAAINFFQNNGWEPHQAAGLVGNLYFESVGMQHHVLGDKGASLGLGQWNGPRRKALKVFAAQMGDPNPDKPEFLTQLQFVQHELEGSHAHAGASLRRARDVTQATLAVRKDYENPGIPHDDRRTSLAKRFLNGVWQAVTPGSAEAAEAPTNYFGEIPGKQTTNYFGEMPSQAIQVPQGDQLPPPPQAPPYTPQQPEPGLEGGKPTETFMPWLKYSSAKTVADTLSFLKDPLKMGRGLLDPDVRQAIANKTNLPPLTPEEVEKRNREYHAGLMKGMGQAQPPPEPQGLYGKVLQGLAGVPPVVAQFAATRRFTNPFLPAGASLPARVVQNAVPGAVIGGMPPGATTGDIAHSAANFGALGVLPPGSGRLVRALGGAAIGAGGTLTGGGEPDWQDYVANMGIMGVLAGAPGRKRAATPPTPEATVPTPEAPRALPGAKEQLGLPGPPEGPIRLLPTPEGVWTPEGSPVKPVPPETVRIPGWQQNVGLPKGWDYQRWMETGQGFPVPEVVPKPAEAPPVVPEGVPIPTPGVPVPKPPEVVARALGVLPVEAGVPGAEVVNRFTANPADLAADYKARGIDRQRAWSLFVKDKNLNPGMDAKDFYKIYDNVSPGLLERKPAKVAEVKPEVLPSFVDPEMARFGEPIEFKTQVGKGEYKWDAGEIRRVLNNGGLFEVTDKKGNVWRMRPENVRSPVETPAPAIAKEPWEMTREEFGKTPLYGVFNRGGGWLTGLTKIQAEALEGFIKSHKKINALNQTSKRKVSLLPEYGTPNSHKLAVSDALASGKPVPPEVLADYPDLAAKYGKGEGGPGPFSLRAGIGPGDLKWLGQKLKDWHGALAETDWYKGYAPPRIRGALGKVPDMYSAVHREVSKGFNIEGLSPMAGKVSESFKVMLSALAQRRDQTHYLFNQYRDFFGRMNMGQFLDFTDRAETGKDVPQELKPFADAWRTASDQRHAEITQSGRELAYLENYWPHQFTKSEVAQQFISEWQSKKLRAPTGFFKERKFPTIREALDWVGPNGERLQLKYHNFVDAVLANLAQKDKFIAIDSFLKELDGKGMLEWIPQGGRAPQGWEAINANYRTKSRWVGKTGVDQDLARWLELNQEEYAPAFRRGEIRIDPDGNIFKMERLVPHVPADAALPINNWLAKGLRGSLAYDAPMSLVHVINTLRVGLSAFHYVFEGLSVPFREGGVNISQALGALMEGNLKGAAKYMGKAGAAYVVAPKTIYDWYKLGKDLQVESLAPGTHPHLTDLAKKVVEAGGRFRPGPEGTMREIAAQTLNEFMGQVKGLNPKAIATLAHTISKPLMDYYVPRVKLGAFAKIAERELKLVDAKYEALNRPLTPQELETWRGEQRTALQGSWQHVDNVWGQMTYDNMTMKKGWRDGLSVLIAYPGWNVGSFRVLFGALKGVAEAPFRKLDQQSRLGLEYATGMLVGTMIYNVMLQTLLQKLGLVTDDGIQAKDVMIGPRTGGMMANGAEERVRWPSYMKDAIGAVKHPIATIGHKLNWPFGVVRDLTNNYDFYGTQIVTPEAPLPTQVGEVGKYLGQSVAPFSIQQFIKGKSPLTKALGLAGITSVPTELASTPAQNMMRDYQTSRVPVMRSKEAYEHTRLKRELIDLSRKGNEDKFTDELVKAIEAGKITETEANDIFKASKEHPTVTSFRRTPLEVALKVWQIATPKEKEMFMPELLRKLDTAKDETLEKFKEPILRVMDELSR